MKVLNFYISLLSLAGIVLCSCDDPTYEEVDMSHHIGDVVCMDHTVMSIAEYESCGRSDAAGVVFSPQTGEHGTLAVSLDELYSYGLQDDSIEYRSMGTGCSTTAFDGFENTVSMMSSGVSTLAKTLYTFHASSQQVYLPSVAELRLLVSARNVVNDVLTRLGKYGSNVCLLQTDDDYCWYWSSTELEEDPTRLAWVCSMQNGGILPAMKQLSYPYRVRSIFSLNY